MKMRLNDRVLQKVQLPYRFGIYQINDRHTNELAAYPCSGPWQDFYYYFEDFLARQIVLLVFGQAVPVKKGIVVLFVFLNTTVLACQELHSELTLFSCLTGFSLPSVLFKPVLAVDYYLMSA